MSEAKQGFPDDRDRAMMDLADELSNLADDLVEWAGQNVAARSGSDFEIGDDEEFELYRMRRLASNLRRSANVPVAAAVYGASQVGKSLFVGRVLQPADERDSPLGLDDQRPAPAYIKELSFEYDINPSSGANEATALVTRFTTQQRFDEDALLEFPVKVRALSRAEWLRVVARGFRSECRQPKDVVWREGQFRALFEEIHGKHGGDTVDREWRIDLLDTYAYLRNIDPRQYEATESLFNAFLSRYPLTSAGYVELAGRLFWDSKNFASLTAMFEEVSKFIQKVRSTGKDGILVHWAAVKFLLDSQRTSIQDSPHSKWKKQTRWCDLKESIRDGWYVIDYQENAGGPSDELWKIQSAMLELVLPVIPERLKSDWADVIHRMDILDLPGMKAGGADTEGGATKIESLPEKMNIVKRGKVFYLIDRYLEERQVQTLLLLVRGGGLEVRQLLKEYIDKWGKARYPDVLWPEEVRVSNPALFIGLTGIDEEFRNQAVNRALYENRLNMIVNEMLYEVMKDFGGKGKPFTNVFPIRYPGSWDCNEQSRNRSDDPGRWQTAKEFFLASPLVDKFIRDAEQKWDISMQDNDGGLSLICKGFINCTTASQKQDALEQQLSALREDLLDLGASWYCDPNSNHDRKQRQEVAEKVLAWMDDPQRVYDRVHAIQNAVCIDETEAMQIAEFAEKRELRMAGRPESVAERFPKFLREVLGTWSRELTKRNWRRHTSQHESGAPWLELEEFTTFSRYLCDYLCTEEVFNEFSSRLLEIVTLPVRDAGDRRFAQRAYIRVIWNDFVLNPGPDEGLLEASGEASSSDTGNGNGNGHVGVDAQMRSYGLMSPFVHRWQRRLVGALCSAAGAYVQIPSGNADLRAILDRY